MIPFRIDFARWPGGTLPGLVSGASSEIPLAGGRPPEGVPRAPARATDWTPERIGALAPSEVRQLLANAERLKDSRIAALCADVLKERPGSGAPASPRRSTASSERHLVSRNSAFGLRGVSLADRFTSRSGLTRHGEVIFALWAADVRHDKKGASCLLWSPNVGGARPWSDKPAGRERHEHCQRALAKGSALGLLVYGERLEGVLPEERAASVDGIDPGQALALRIEKRGKDYWALWGDKRG